MKIPKKFKTREGRGKQSVIRTYEFVKIYPNFIQYRCVETGVLECFQKSYFVMRKRKELFGNDNYCN